MIVDALKTPWSVWKKKDKLLCHNCSFECSLSSPNQLMSANLHQAARCNEWIWEVWRWKWISPTCTWWDVISPAFRRLLRAGETFDFTMLHLHPNSSLSVSRLTNNYLLPTLEPGVSKAHSYERERRGWYLKPNGTDGLFFPQSYEVSEAKDTHRFAERWCVFYERLTLLWG